MRMLITYGGTTDASSTQQLIQSSFDGMRHAAIVPYGATAESRMMHRFVRSPFRNKTREPWSPKNRPCAGHTYSARPHPAIVRIEDAYGPMRHVGQVEE